MGAKEFLADPLPLLPKTLLFLLLVFSLSPLTVVCIGILWPDVFGHPESPNISKSLFAFGY